MVRMTFTWLIFLIQALLSGVFLIEYNVEGVSILIIALTSIFLMIDLSRKNFPKEIYIILLISYLLRIFFLFFDLYGQELFILPNSGFDSEMFHEAALHGIATGDYGRGHIYSYVVGIIYSLFGNNRMISQFINVLFSMHGILIVYSTLKLYNVRDKAKYNVLALISLMPNFAILSSLLLRESVIIFLCILSFYCFSLWLVKNRTGMLMLAYALGLLIAIFHSGSIFLIISYTVFLILYNREKHQFNFSVKSVAAAIVFAFIFMVLFQNFYDLFFAKFSNIEDLTDVTDIHVMGESGYSVGFAIGNPIVNFVVNTPIRVFYFVFSPLPWDWRGIFDVMAFAFSGMYYGYVLYFSFKNLIKGKLWNGQLVVFLLLIISVGLIVFAWGVSNAGTALRHRDKFIGLYAVLLGLLLNKEEPRRNSI